MDKIQEFHLQRVVDESGISGTGVVARGCVLPSGLAVMEWLSFHSSVTFFRQLSDIEAIHGHDGKTLVVMGPPPVTPKKTKKKESKTV